MYEELEAGSVDKSDVTSVRSGRGIDMDTEEELRAFILQYA